MRLPIINRFTCNVKQLESFIKEINSKNMKVIVDYANENQNDFNKNYRIMKELILSKKSSHIAIKLSSLNIHNYSYAYESSLDLISQAVKNRNKIFVDAEDFLIQESIDSISDDLMSTFNKNEVNVYKTYQMYRNDYLNILRNDLMKDRGYYIGCKLVRGAYYNQDKKYNILFNTIEDTHNSYNHGIESFNEFGKEKDKLLCATHNEESIDKALSYKNKNIEYAQLLGMSDNLSQKLVNNGETVYKYLPFGNFQETLPYLIRRLYENYPILLNIFK